MSGQDRIKQMRGCNVMNKTLGGVLLEENNQCSGGVKRSYYTITAKAIHL